MLSRWGVAWIAILATAAELAVSGRYGYHRDELYFLECARHLAFGYVDQPLLTPLVARLSTSALGNSLVGLRVVPALLLGTVVLVTARMARELGAPRRAQVLAAACAATCGEYLGVEHSLSTAGLDLALSSAVLALVLRLLATGDTRWWLAIGAAVGLAAEAKWNVAFLVLALLGGFLLTPERRLLATRWLWVGGAAAVALASPDLVWQASHHWPNLQVFHALDASAGHNRATYWPAQVVYTGLVLTPIWVMGAIASLRSGPLARFRAVGIGCWILLLAQFVLGGKPYYPEEVFTFLFAAGAVRLESRATMRGIGLRRTMTAVAVSGGLAAFVALPVLPARVLHTVPLQSVNADLGETIGWPSLVALVAREYRDLPPAVRRHTAIVTGNYGEAGAVDRYGPQFGLPVAYCGQNNFWLWGPPPAADRTALVVNLSTGLLRREFGSVRPLAQFHNGLGISDQEEGVVLELASGLRTSWPAAWPAFRHDG